MQDQSAPTTADGGTRRPAASELVELTVPLRSAYLATVRTMAAALAADAGFSIDEIDDIRLALGEVVTAYLDAVDAEGDRAHAEFSVDGEALTITVRPERGDPRVRFDDLASGILAAVVDGFDVGDRGVSMFKRATERSSHDQPA